MKTRVDKKPSPANPRTIRSAVKYGSPVPLRLDDQQKDHLRTLKNSTRLNYTQLLRLAVNYALPRLVNGELRITDLGTSIEAK